MVDEAKRKGRKPDGGSRSSVAALVFVVLLVGLVFWAIQAMVRHNALQNCLDSGRRDCASSSGAP